MKKNTVKAFICLFFPISLFSQNNWKTTGNSGTLPDPITATSFLGTTNNFPLNLKTALAQPINFYTGGLTPAFQRMTITPTGLVGIGNNFLNPSSVLHINGTGYANGDVFKTTGPANQINAWRLETGNNEKFSLFVPLGLADVYLQSSRNTADMGFNTSGIVGVTHTPYTRMLIQGGNATVTDGYLSLGNNLPSGFTPLDRLHLHQDAASDVRTRFTHSTATNGSTLGINNAGQYMFTQFENQAMIFETNGTNERFRITEDDRIIAFRRASLFSNPPVNYPAYISKFEIDDRNFNS